MRVVPLVMLALGGLAAFVALIAAPFYLDRFRRELSRADEIEGIAHELSLTFARTDPAYPGSTAFHYPFELFSRGVEQTCENFVRGTIEGVDLIAFDFLYRQRVDSDGEPGNDIRSEPVRFSCAVATVVGARPHVVIEPASAPPPDRAGGEPVRLEWGRFQRALPRDLTGPWICCGASRPCAHDVARGRGTAPSSHVGNPARSGALSRT